MLPRLAAGWRLESSDHQSDHRPFDHGLAGLRQSLVVVVEAAAFHDPGEGALDHPPPWKHLEHLDSQGFTHDLDGDVGNRLGPVDQLAGVAAVGPQQRQRRHRHRQPVQQRAGAVAVLHARRGDHHQQQQAHRVDHDVALAAVDLLAGIESAHGRPDGVGALDRLGVHAAGRGHGVPIAGIAHPVPQGIVQPVDHTVLAPALVVPEHRRPRWKVVRQLTPRAPGAVDVEDGVHDAAPRMHRWTATRARRGHQRLDQLPLRVGQVGRIALVLGHKPTLATSATSVTQARRVTFPTRSKFSRGSESREVVRRRQGRPESRRDTRCPQGRAAIPQGKDHRGKHRLDLAAEIRPDKHFPRFHVNVDRRCRLDVSDKDDVDAVDRPTRNTVCNAVRTGAMGESIISRMVGIR